MEKRDRKDYYTEYRLKNLEKKREYDRKRYYEDNEKRKDQAKKYHNEHKEELKEKKIKYLTNKYEVVLFRSAKNRATRDNKSFSIEVSDILIPEYCPYLGVKITKILGEGKVWTNASLDRIDNSKGYEKENIEVISLQANIMKHQATPEQLIIFAKSILKRFDSK